MIKSMVVAVDTSESSVRAQAYAVTLAKRYNAELTGIAVLDTPWVTRPMAMPIGGGHYKDHRDEKMLAKQRSELDKRISEFRDYCRKEGVPARAVEVEGVPAEQIAHEADRHDLIIIGRDTNFHGVNGQDIGDEVEQLLRDNPRPVIMIPPNAPLPGKGVVVSFDGSIPASRAMQMFHLMGLGKGERIHVLSIDEDDDKAQLLAARGAAYFESHGVSVTKHALQASSEIAQTILNTVESMNAGMLVMGAFSNRSLWRQLIVGSVTKQLLRACPVPIFIHH